MVTPISTGAQDAGKEGTGPKGALVWRRLEALSPYDREAWVRELERYSLQGRYPSLVQGLTEGFNLGIPRILHTHVPPNNLSISILPHVYTKIIKNEFAAGRYVVSRTKVLVRDGPIQRHLLQGKQAQDVSLWVPSGVGPDGPRENHAVTL